MKSRFLRFDYELLARGEVFRELFEEAGWSKPSLRQAMFRYQGAEFIGEFSLHYSKDDFRLQEYFSNASLALIDPLWKKQARDVKKYLYSDSAVDELQLDAKRLRSLGDSLALGEVLFIGSGDGIFQEITGADPLCQYPQMLLLLTGPATINQERFEHIATEFARVISGLSLEQACDYAVSRAVDSMIPVAGMLGAAVTRGGRDVGLDFLERMMPRLSRIYEKNAGEVLPVIVVAQWFLGLSQAELFG